MSGNASTWLPSIARRSSKQRTTPRSAGCGIARLTSIDVPNPDDRVTGASPLLRRETLSRLGSKFAFHAGRLPVRIKKAKCRTFLRNYVSPEKWHL